MTRFKGSRKLWESALIEAFLEARERKDADLEITFGWWYLILYHKQGA